MRLMNDNALYEFTRISKMSSDLERLGDPGKPSVLGRRSYIDDILVPTHIWDQLCDRIEDLLEAHNKWNLSISVVESFWGMPKWNISVISRIIEDYAIYASVLYELREIDYSAMEKCVNQSRIQLALASETPGSDKFATLGSGLAGPDLEPRQQDPNPVSWDLTLGSAKVSDSEKDNFGDLDPRWIHAHNSFNVLKKKITTTPILRHYEPDQQAIVLVYGSDWAISGALMQKYDQIYYPVMCASRTLKSNALIYGIAEKEVLAFLRILDLHYNTVVGRPI
ncbi:reverse transcriptase [Phytophthora megakarya]|uniref:Reverse transcriptase n=1 Tax=Phytophthora megakarya TaxID=4795 RepID=A0A225WAD9_9STRA|nr:reverse transcriptase [Phytophthora megakarya]